MVNHNSIFRNLHQNAHMLYNSLEEITFTTAGTLPAYTRKLEGDQRLD